MTGSGAYQTRPSSKFEASYRRLVKKHYRKNPQARAEFEKVVEGFLELMRAGAEPPEVLGHREPWPAGMAREGFELWKIHFVLPGLRGAAAEGRLIYLVEHQQRIAHLAWIYTHDDFAKRPPDKEMRRLLKEMLRS